MSPRFKPETGARVLIDYQVGTMQLIKKLIAVLVTNTPNAIAFTNGAAGEERRITRPAG